MNYKLVVCYDGSRYYGWQRLRNTDMTVQGKLEAVLSRMAGENVEIIGSGRTDAGVHAAEQVANFHLREATSCDWIRDYLRQYLPEDIGVISVSEADDRFHSRFHALEKTYRYRIWNSAQPCIFDRKYIWKLDKNLDVEKMNAAAQEFVGCHDFMAFCSNKHFKKSSVRTVKRFSVERFGPEIVFTVSADGFLYNMVRIMVGTLVSVGCGEMSSESIGEIFKTRTRENAGITAPAKGLCLMEVLYK